MRVPQYGADSGAFLVPTVLVSHIQPDVFAGGALAELEGPPDLGPVVAIGRP